MLDGILCHLRQKRSNEIGGKAFPEKHVCSLLRPCKNVSGFGAEQKRCLLYEEPKSYKCGSAKRRSAE